MWEKEREWEGEGGMWEGGRRKTQTQREKRGKRKRNCMLIFMHICSDRKYHSSRWFLNIGNTLDVGRFATAVNLPLYLAVKPNVPSEEVHYRIRQPDF